MLRQELAIKQIRKVWYLIPREMLFLLVYVFGLSFYAYSIKFVDDPSIYRFFPPFIKGTKVNNNNHLGAEYYHIAQAIAAGKGFSNPFIVNTGPTAWMPPIYPSLLALLIKLFKRKGVVLVILLLKNLVLVFTGMIVFVAAKNSSNKLNPRIALVFYAIWLATYFYWFFQFTHDIWLILFFIDSTLVFAWIFSSKEAKTKHIIGWGVLGGLNFLANPIAGLVWLSVACLISIQNKLYKGMLLSALLAMLICSGWIIRNAVVFDKFIFIKSNLFYDLYRINYEDSDGIYDRTLAFAHPVWTTMLNPDSPYKRLGEIKFNEYYKKMFFRQFKNNPEEYFKKIKNRLIAATLIYSHNSPYEGRHPPIKTVIFALPFLSLLLLLILNKFRLNRIIWVAVTLYVAYIILYVGVAFCMRYFLPLTSILVLFVFWGIDALVSRITLRPNIENNS